MPWHLEGDNPGCKGWAVVKDSDGKVVGCHKTKKDALAQLAALNINVKEAPVVDTNQPPRDDLVRATPRSFEVRAADGEQAMPTMVGHFAVFGQWAEIAAIFEGHF